MTTNVDPTLRLLRRPLEHPGDRHTRLAGLLIDAGVTPSPQWAALRGRLNAFAALDGRPQLDRLIDAVVNGGSDDDLPLLRVLSCAEADVSHRDPVFVAVRGAVYPRLVEAWDGDDAYRVVAAQFDAAAAKFTTAARAGDPELDASELLGASDKVRRSWLDSEKLAHDLDRRMTPLVAAAALADLRLRDDTDLLPLCVDPGDAHRRRVWESWERTGGRCGRWSALVALGVELRAWPAGDLDEFEPYRKPKPFVVKQFRRAGQAYGEYTRVTIDPEDPPEEQPQLPEPEPRPARRKRAPAPAQ